MSTSVRPTKRIPTAAPRATVLVCRVSEHFSDAFTFFLYISRYFADAAFMRPFPVDTALPFAVKPLSCWSESFESLFTTFCFSLISKCDLWSTSFFASPSIQQPSIGRTDIKSHNVSCFTPLPPILQKKRLWAFCWLFSFIYYLISS